MKTTLVYIFLFTFSIVLSQNNTSELDDIVHYERKAASQKINFVPNPNTNNYDITYHKLEFTVDPAVYFISGKVTTTYTALADMSTVTFDLTNDLTVSSVLQNGLNLSYIQNSNNELVINLPSIQLSGTNATVEINYSGTPPGDNSGGFTTSTHNDIPILWTLSEPFNAMNWWPCKQDLNDKTNSIDVYITAPLQYISVSNGVEPEAPIISGNLKTTHFHHGYPIPAYLIAIAVTNYSVYTQNYGTEPNQFPIVNYLYPETYNENIPKLDQTPLIMAFFESKFKPYPFRNEKYGHAQFGWGGGMEHTTVSFMVNFNRGLIAHELAHQWFGDDITCGSWNNIWLNEGFATYLASMVIEKFDGETAFINNKNEMIINITSLPNGAIYVPENEVDNESRIFSGRLSYRKGAMVLNMLRFKLGDNNFFQGLNDYLNDPNLSYGYARTPDLQAHLETASGMNLSEFFNDWVYQQGYPIYDIQASNYEEGKMQIIVNQSQSDTSVDFFEMPIPIRFLGENGVQQDVVLDNTFNGQSYIVDVPFVVTEVVFDPKKDIISNNNTVTLTDKNFDLNASIVVYPNPVSNKLYLEIPESLKLNQIIIYNSLGQKVGNFTSKIIAVENLSDGIYTLKIETSEGSVYKKIIKK